MKKIIRAFYNFSRKTLTGYRLKKNMVKKISQSKVKIADLSDQEIKEIKEYWTGKYGLKPDLNSFRWYYSVNGVKDPRYISEDIYTNYIWTRLNNMKRCKGINDKNMLDILYSGYNLPTTVFHNINGVFLDNEYKIISRESAIARAKQLDRIVIKAAIDSCRGNDVVCVAGNECENYIKRFTKDYIVQTVVKQHDSFSALNESSVNVIRMTSVLLNNEVHILDSIIRVGAPGNFTDHKNIAIGVDDEGRLRNYGVTVHGEKVTELQNGVVFSGMKLAGYSEMKKIVKELHAKTPQAKLIGWDLTADESGHALIIEANMDFPGIGRGQDCNGPFFGDLTDEILKYVMNG